MWMVVFLTALAVDLIWLGIDLYLHLNNLMTFSAYGHSCPAFGAMMVLWQAVLVFSLAIHIYIHPGVKP